MSDVIQQSILNKSRKDKFLLVLNLPDALKGINTAGQNVRENDSLNLDTLQYSIYGSVVPPTKIPATNLSYRDQSLNVTTYKRVPYDEITVGFTVDNGFNNWWVLWKWLDYINNAKEGSFDKNDLTNFPKTYVGTFNMQPYQTKITVYGLDEYNNKKIQFDYTKAFITNLAGINYDYKVPDQIESSFTFSFSQFLPQLLV